jgi:hypothetical protein
MKVVTKNVDIDGFTPFDLVLTIESQEESDAIRNIFNHSFIIQAANFHQQSDDIRAKLDCNSDFNKFDKAITNLFERRNR